MSAPANNGSDLAAARSRLGPNERLFELTAGVVLHLLTFRFSIESDSENVVCVALYLGAGIDGQRLALLHAAPDQIRVGEDLSVWFGAVNVEMPWNVLRQVANFLHLDIPQPELPSGQEVPR